jgi:hypothetical protein
MTNASPYYQIVTFGRPTYGERRGYYRSADRAIRDARTLGGGSLQAVRVVACSSLADAYDADISDSHRHIVYAD